MSEREHLIDLPRLIKSPTDDVLKLEAAGAAQILADVWDGEVEVLVLMARKGEAPVAWATSAKESERVAYFAKQIHATNPFRSTFLHHGEIKK